MIAQAERESKASIQKMQDRIAELVEAYRLTEKDLRELLSAIEAERFQLNILSTYRDMSIPYSATSDGLTIFLHQDEAATGGPAARCYDLLHLAFGHFWQWGASEESGLQFTGDLAWSMAVGDFFGAPAKEIAVAAAYEMEAHRLSCHHLNRLTGDGRLRQLMVDWMATDHAFLMEYYSGVERPRMFEKWQWNSNIEPLEFRGPLKPRLRARECVPVLRISS